MDQAALESILADVDLPAIRYFPTIDSTNDEAWRWVEAGATHGALVLADEQTAGRGRLDRRWVTAKGSGLAFSLVLHSPPIQARFLSHITGLGALATCQALLKLYSQAAQIKWPNDILLSQRKVGGVLVEARWNGGDLQTVVIGIGVNITPLSVSAGILPVDTVLFPATSVETILGKTVDRLELLHAILKELFSWIPRLSSQEFLQTWQAMLAFRGQWVELRYGDVAQPSPLKTAAHPLVIGKLVGLAADGSIQVQTSSGKIVTAQVGEIHLRPIQTPSPG